METRPELLTIDETAEFLRVSDKTVRRMIDDGRLEAVAIGRQWRIPREALAELTRPRTRARSRTAARPCRTLSDRREHPNPAGQI